MRFLFVLVLAVIVVGVVLAMTTGSLLGVLLIIGGLAGLGWVVVQDVVERFATFLSTGSFRRRDWGN